MIYRTYLKYYKVYHLIYKTNLFHKYFYVKALCIKTPTKKMTPTNINFFNNIF